MGEMSSMFHKMFERDDQSATDQQHVDTMHAVLAHVAIGRAINIGMGDYIPWQGASGFREHGGDPIQDAPIGEDHGQMTDSMALKIVVGHAYAGTRSAVNNAARGQWTPEEDKILQKLTKQQHGKRAWSDIAREFPGRTGKQCRERWINHLDPETKRTAWAEDEQLILVKYHKKLGKKWAQIARHIPGRSENSIKNQWYAAERSLKAKRKNKTKETRPSILVDYIRGLKKEGKGTPAVPTGPVHAASTRTNSGQKIKEVTVPFPGSNFAASSQVPASGDNPLLPPSSPFLGLNVGDHYTLEAMYDDAVFVDKHQPSAYPQESGYLPSPYVLPPGRPYAEDHPAGGYYNQLQFHHHPISAQQEQAFSNYRAAEDPNQVFAGRYYHEAAPNQVMPGLYYQEAGPSHYDIGGGSGNPTGFSEILANRLAMLAIDNEGPSLNPPGGFF